MNFHRVSVQDRFLPEGLEQGEEHRRGVLEILWRGASFPTMTDAFAEQALGSLRHDPGSMLEIRKILSRAAPGVCDLSRMSDDEVLACVVRRFAVRQRPTWSSPAASSTGEKQPAAQETQALAAAASTPRAQAERRTPEPEPATFAPAHDPAAQAAALTAAAVSGVPFCEECARRQAARGL